MAQAKLATAPSADDEELTIASTARAALERAEGDVIKATEIMVAQVLNDPKLYKPLMDPMVKAACYDAITNQCRHQRRAIWHSKQPTTEQQRLRVVSLAEGTAETLMDFRLKGGMKLRDARRDDVLVSADFWGKQSKDMGGKAKWLQLIAQHITGKKKVSQVMTNERLAELREEATRD